jgi:hypothetical protein
LSRHAPYSTEDALQSFLENQGLRVERLEIEPPPADYWTWYNALSAFYERREDRTGRKLLYKVLVKHEAWQLFRLAQDEANDIRAVFVTEDGQLRRAIAAIRDGELADNVMTGVTMTNFVDLLLGVKVDDRGLARMLWGVHAIDAGGIMRRYFTDLALKRRDEVATLVLPEVVGQIMARAEADARYPDLSVGSGESPERENVSAFLDRFEEDFYQLLDEAVQRRNAQFEEALREPLLDRGASHIIHHNKKAVHRARKHPKSR